MNDQDKDALIIPPSNKDGGLTEKNRVTDLLALLERDISYFSNPEYFRVRSMSHCFTDLILNKPQDLSLIDIWANPFQVIDQGESRLTMDSFSRYWPKKLDGAFPEYHLFIGEIPIVSGNSEKVFAINLSVQDSHAYQEEMGILGARKSPKSYHQDFVNKFGSGLNRTSAIVPNTALQNRSMTNTNDRFLGYSHEIWGMTFHPDTEELVKVNIFNGEVDQKIAEFIRSIFKAVRTEKAKEQFNPEYFDEGFLGFVRDREQDVEALLERISLNPEIITINQQQKLKPGD